MQPFLNKGRPTVLLSRKLGLHCNSCSATGKIAIELLKRYYSAIGVSCAVAFWAHNNYLIFKTDSDVFNFIFDRLRLKALGFEIHFKKILLGKLFYPLSGLILGVPWTTALTLTIKRWTWIGWDFINASCVLKHFLAAVSISSFPFCMFWVNSWKFWTQKPAVSYW